MADIQVENIIVVTRMAKALDLAVLSHRVADAMYHPEEFPGLIMHVDTPRAAVMLFADGKTVCTGAKTMDDVETVIQLIAERLRGAGVTVKKKPTITVQHLVASVDLNKMVDLEVLAQKMALENAAYNPKRFPGLVYTLERPTAVVLLFNSGKLVCTGATLEDVSTAIETMTNKLSSFGM